MLCLGFHQSVSILLMSGSMFLTSPFQPPQPSTPPVKVFLRCARRFYVCAIVVGPSIWGQICFVGFG
jgi:hypothetical protein